MSPEKFQEYAAYLEKKPKLYDEACRKIPDLFIARMYRVVPSLMHIQMQRFLDEHRTCGLFVPRNHGKTTQVSIGRVAWEVGNDPNIRVQIVQATLPDARKTVRAIKETIESEAFGQVFPNIVPDKEDWGTGSLTVRRSRIGMRDSTVTAQPIFGKAGQRSDLLLFDDIENLENSIRQEGLRAQVKEAYRETWLSTLEPGGREWRVGTPWHVDGITSDWIKEGHDHITPMFYRACTGTEWSPWWEKFPAAELRSRRAKMGEIAYARAFCLRAISGDEIVFRDADLLDNACELPDRRRLRTPVRWAGIDLAFSDEQQGLKRQKRDEPDFSVMGIADLTADGHVYMVRNHRVKMSYPKFRALAVAEAVRHGVQRVVIESNGPQKGLRQDMAVEFSKHGIAVLSNTRTSDKMARASAVQHVVEQGRFHMRKGPDGRLMDDMQAMYREMSTFPVSGKDDTVDVAVDLMAQAKIQNLPDEVRTYDNTFLPDIKEQIVAGHEKTRGESDADEYARINEDLAERWGFE